MIWLPFDSLECWQITLTLLHVSWVGFVIGLIAAFANRVLRGSAASRRYWLNFASLLMFAVSLPVTFAIIRSVTIEVPIALSVEATPVAELATLTPPVTESTAFFTPPNDAVEFPPNAPQSLPSDVEIPEAVPSGTVIQPTPSVWGRIGSVVHTAAPFIVILYAIGVALMFVKLAFGVRVSRKLRSASQPISDATILARLADQAKKLSLRMTPVVAYCEHTAVPIVVGLLRPMILIPAAMVNGLTIEQLESVLTHELAHLRRRDHLMLVVQRVVEAILFFHPVTWYLSHRLHDDRETSCDDLVLSIGGDRLQYAQSLLRVAELRLASKSHQKHIALAADGQRPSKLRERIARLLGDSERDSVRVSSVWLVVTVLAFLIVGIASLSSTMRPAFAAVKDDAELDYESVLKLAGKAYENPPQVATAHVKFRIAELDDGFQEGMTSAKCRRLLSESGVTSHPDKLKELLSSLIKEPNHLEAKPWTNVELYQGAPGIRTTTSTSSHGPDYWVGHQWSYRWDSAKSQASLLRREDDWFHKDETLNEFLQQRRMTFANLKFQKPISIRKDGDRILLQFERNSELQEETMLDAVSGRIHSVANSSHGVVHSERLQLGWRAFNDDFWLPTVIAELRYRRGELENCRCIVIEDASFNQPLPDRIFSFSVPAGSVISDKRVGLNQTYKINRDVDDVTSDEELEAARAPLPAAANNEKIGPEDAAPHDLGDLNPQYSDAFFSKVILTDGVQADDANDKGNRPEPWKARIHGQCTDADRKPIEDVIVRLFNRDEVTRQGVLVKELRTDADGHFDFGEYPELDSSSRYTVTLSKPSYGSTDRAFRSRHDAADHDWPGNATLYKADTYTGQVIDPDGRPIADAKVRCINCDLGVGSDVTDANGRFSISDHQRPFPDSTSTRVFVEHSYWGRKTYQSEICPEEETIQLEYPAVAEGVAIRRDGTPVANLPLYAAYVRDEPTSGSRNTTEIATYTDANGRFQFRFQGAAKIYIRSHPSYRSLDEVPGFIESFEIVVGETRTTPPIMVTEGAIIVGRITSKYAPDPDKILTETDFKNIHVSCQPGSKSGPGPFGSIANLQSDGTYRLRVPAGQSVIKFGWTDWLSGVDSPTRMHYAVWPHSDTERQVDLEEGQTYNLNFNVARAVLPKREIVVNETPQSESPKADQ